MSMLVRKLSPARGKGAASGGEDISFPRRLLQTLWYADLRSLAALRATRLYHRGTGGGSQGQWDSTCSVLVRRTSLRKHRSGDCQTCGVSEWSRQMELNANAQALHPATVSHGSSSELLTSRKASPALNWGSVQSDRQPSPRSGIRLLIGYEYSVTTS